MKSINRRFLTSPLDLPAEYKFSPFYAKVFGIPTLHVCNNELAEMVLVQLSNILSGKAGNRSVAQGLFGSSLLYDDGLSHAALKDDIGDLFDLRGHAIERDTRAVTMNIAYQYKRRDPIATLEFFRIIAVAITCQQFMNLKLDFDECLALSTSIDYLGTGLYASSPSSREGSRFRKAVRARKEIDSFMLNNFPNNFSMAMARKGYCQQVILDQAVTFLFAGVDTTSVTMTLALYNLYQSGKTEYSDIPEIKKAIFDSLHQFPPVYFIPRGALDDCEVGGNRVRKGWNVNVMVHAVQNSPDATGIRPQIAFGLGKKRCPGEAFALLSSRFVIASLLDDYLIEMHGGNLSRLAFVPGLRPTHSPVLKLFPRN